MLFLAKKDEAASPKLAADLTLQALNCVACHERDGQGGPDAARKPYFQGDDTATMALRWGVIVLSIVGVLAAGQLKSMREKAAQAS